MRITRIVLVLVGAVVIGLGGVVLALDESVPKIVGVFGWLVAAVIVHDGILAPFAFGADVVMRKTGRRFRPAHLAIAQTGVIVGAVLSLVVVPEIYAKTLGNPNATVLPFDYGLRLAIAWAVVLLLTAAAEVLYTVRARRAVSTA
jgi:hypothetical protein